MFSTSYLCKSDQNSKLVIRIFTHCKVWWGKRWETSFWTCAPLSKTIIATISWSVLWVVVRSLLQGHQSKWLHRSSMVWPHWHHERWATKGCCKPRQIHNVVRKWVDDKQNVGVVGRINNQAHALGPAHERKHVYTIFEGVFTRSETNTYLCGQFAK
jgi:hypothetical protein